MHGADRKYDQEGGRLSATVSETVSAPVTDSKRTSIRALEWTNFFFANVQAGLGPFVAAYLASLGWQAGSVGRALTFADIMTVALQTPAGSPIDEENAIGAWKERDILGTQLGPNKNGKKW